MVPPRMERLDTDQKAARKTTASTTVDKEPVLIEIDLIIFCLSRRRRRSMVNELCQRLQREIIGICQHSHCRHDGEIDIAGHWNSSYV